MLRLARLSVWKRTSLAVAVVLLSGLVLASCTQQANALGSTPLHWIAVDTGVEGLGVLQRTAIMVDVEVNGKTLWLQLDTGSDATVLAPSIMKALGISYREGALIESGTFRGGFRGQVASLSVAGIAVKDADVVIWEESTHGTDQGLISEMEKTPAGTLGAPFFRGRTLVLDFLNDVLTVYDRMPAVAQPVSIPMERLLGGIPFVRVRVGGKTLSAMYDTGSSSLDIVLNTSAFLELTGLSNLDDAPLKWSANSWGQQVIGYACAYDGEVDVGGRLLRPSRIWTFSSMDDLAKNAGFDVILGNELFAGKTIYLDFGAKRFAVMGVR